MRDHPTVARVQDFGCAALWNLSADTTGKRAVLAAEGHIVVIAAIHSHGAASAKVAENACGALANLTSEQGDRKAVSKAKGVRVRVSRGGRRLKNEQNMRMVDCMVYCFRTLNTHNTALPSHTSTLPFFFITRRSLR
jgi:hypothetical protein